MSGKITSNGFAIPAMFSNHESSPPSYLSTPGAHTDAHTTSDTIIAPYVSNGPSPPSPPLSPTEALARARREAYGTFKDMFMKGIDGGQILDWSPDSSSSELPSIWAWQVSHIHIIYL